MTLFPYRARHRRHKGLACQHDAAVISAIILLSIITIIVKNKTSSRSNSRELEVIDTVAKDEILVPDETTRATHNVPVAHHRRTDSALELKMER